MTLPLILLPTYARIRWLEEQLACLLAQDAECRVLILNDCPWQHLISDGLGNDRVSVMCVNIDPFPNMGAKRNWMLRMAGESRVLWADDDDLCLPWLVSGFLRVLTPQGSATWARMFRSYSLWGDAWSTNRWPLGCCGPAAEWLARGGAIEADVGEDTSLRDLLPDDAPIIMQPAYIYQWGQGTYHLSGKMLPVAFPRYRDEAEDRRQKGMEPTGVIKLQPRLRKRYWDTAPIPVRELLSAYSPALWDYDLAP